MGPRASSASGLPVVFLPGRHPPADDPGPPQGQRDRPGDAPTRSPSPRWRCGSTRRDAAAASPSSTFAVVELGSAFSAVLVVSGGRLVDASAGTRGPIGLRSGGAWDGEVAYWRSPLSKDDLFRGGLRRPRARRPRRLPRVADQARRRPAGRHPVRPALPLGRRGRPPRDRRAGDRGPRPVRHASSPCPRSRRLGQARRAGRGPPGRRPGRRPRTPTSSTRSRLRDASGTVLDWLRPRP